METLCREAYPLPENPPYYVEFGDQVEDWDEVRARAKFVLLVQSVNRAPWTAVYRVHFNEGPKPKYYLVAA